MSEPKEKAREFWIAAKADRNLEAFEFPCADYSGYYRAVRVIEFKAYADLEENLRVAVEKQAITEKYLRMSVQYLREGKAKFAPNTTNSYVDDLLRDFESFDKIKGGSDE